MLTRVTDADARAEVGCAAGEARPLPRRRELGACVCRRSHLPVVRDAVVTAPIATAALRTASP